MQTEVGSQFEVAPHPEVPFEARHAVMERLFAARQLETKRLGGTARRASLIVQGYRRDLGRLMGAKKYEQFRAYIERKKEEQRKTLLPPHGPEMSDKEKERLHTQRNKSGLAFLDRLDVDPDRVRKLNQATRKRLVRLMPPVPKRKGKPVILVHTPDVPREIRRGRTNPWDVKAPPFPGWAWHYHGCLIGFSFHPWLYLNSGAGLVGNSNYLTDGDASDVDLAWMGYNSYCGFWYKMPKTGLLEVWIEGQSAFNLHSCHLKDEWGWSDSEVHQHNLLVMRVASPVSDELREALMSWWWERGHTSGYWANHYLVNGGTYWAHLFSDASFAKGTWVYVLVGTRTWNTCFANDVEVYSKVKFKWFIKRVFCRSTG